MNRSATANDVLAGALIDRASTLGFRTGVAMPDAQARNGDDACQVDCVAESQSPRLLMRFQTGAFRAAALVSLALLLTILRSPLEAQTCGTSGCGSGTVCMDCGTGPRCVPPGSTCCEGVGAAWICNSGQVCLNCDGSGNACHEASVGNCCGTGICPPDQCADCGSGPVCVVNSYQCCGTPADPSPTLVCQSPNVCSDCGGGSVCAGESQVCCPKSPYPCDSCTECGVCADSGLTCCGTKVCTAQEQCAVCGSETSCIPSSASYECCGLSSDPSSQTFACQSPNVCLDCGGGQICTSEGAVCCANSPFPCAACTECGTCADSGVTCCGTESCNSPRECLDCGSGPACVPPGSSCCGGVAINESAGLVCCVDVPSAAANCADCGVGH